MRRTGGHHGEQVHPHLLNDHLALLIGTQELGRRSLESNQGSPYGEFLQKVLECTEREAGALHAFMGSEGIRENHTKTASAWLGERIGRLKLNGELTGYSPLSRLVEIEGLSVALQAKRIFWDTLVRIGFAEVGDLQAETAAEKADRQLKELEIHRLDTIPQALGLADSPAE